MARNVLAFDFGASSGRAMLGAFDGKKITLREVHRFSNDPVNVGDAFYWDVLRLYHEIQMGLTAAHADGGFESLGIDTWGVDYGLLDGRGNWMGNVYHYRDARNARAAAQVLEKIPASELFARTGTQLEPFNTIFQLHAAQTEQPWLFENAHSLLMLPDLFNFFLSGIEHTDYTEASTSALLHIHTGDWDFELINALGYPARLFGKVSRPGEVLGGLRQRVREDLMIPDARLISVASHDTASAVLAAYAAGADTAYLSCGTWSLFGTLLERPDTSDAAFRANFTNEGAFDGRIRFLKNIMGLWLIQESRRYWRKTGKNLSFADLEELARACRPFQSFIDVDDPVFSPPGDIPARIRKSCVQTGQPVPESVGEIMQCIYGSLALKYRYTLESLSALTGQCYKALHLVGGGMRDKTLCQLTADMCDVPVLAGPCEATVAGNIAAQLIALGEIGSPREAGEIIQASFPVCAYLPQGDTDAKKIVYLQYKRVIKP